jgi:NADH-quinone oxidoreductase subunit G/NADP-reducing hydrogenase subunit HndD
MEKNKIHITANGKDIIAAQGQTILEALKENGIKVPTLCYHSDLDIKANCRICVVEILNKKGLFTACSTKVDEGMVILTESEKVRKARKINLELIFSQHREECSDCIFGFDCRLLSLAKEYRVNINRFFDRKTKFPVYQFGPSLIFDSTKCIDCQNCVEMCHKQGVDFLEIKQKGDFFQVVPSADKKKDCTYCGQCIIHCPVGAFEAVGEFENVERYLEDKDKTVVFQFAPAVRASIGEEFGMAPGSLVTESLVAGIKKLGAAKVFDVSVGADFTTIEESNELLEKLEKGTGPCFSSCCPAWVKYIEFNYPEFIPNLATTRSPQMILGGLIKSYWAKKEGIDSKKIVVVSVMPCVSKKYEIERKEFKVSGQKPVDYVLTTRELAYLFLKYKIDLVKIKPENADAPLGLPTGAGEIYGASGGVVESVLRTIYKKIIGKNLPEIEFKKVRGLQGTKIANVNIGKKVVKIAIINGLGNAKKVLESLKENPKLYDAVEVMACPGGCIGGGGQPVPTDSNIREARAAGLYSADKKREMHSADESPIIKTVYQDFLNSQETRHKICHTKYSKKNKEVNFNK